MTPVKPPFQPIVLRSGLGMLWGSLASMLLRYRTPIIAPSRDMEVRHDPRPMRGYGLFATRPLRPGTLLICEQPLLTVPMIPQGMLVAYDRDSVHAAFDALPLSSQLAIWSLESKKGIQEDVLLGANRLLAIIALNAFNRSGGGDPPRPMSDLFLTGSRFNHSCVANVNNVLASEHDGTMEFRVCRDVEAGEELTISYIDKMLPFEMRQDSLQEVYGFVCRCPACDPNDTSLDSQAHEKRLHRVRTQGSVRTDVAFDSGTKKLRKGVGRAALEQALERATRRYENLVGLFPPAALDEAMAAVAISQELVHTIGTAAIQTRRYYLHQKATDASITVLGDDHEHTQYMKKMLQRMSRNLSARDTLKLPSAQAPTPDDIWKTTDGMGKMSPRTRRVVSDILG